MSRLKQEREELSKLLVKLLQKKSRKEVAEQLRHISSAMACCKVIPEGDYIVREEVIIHHVFVIFRGEVATWKSSANGKSYLISKMEAPQFLGIDRALNVEQTDVGTNTCIATQNCEILIVNQGYFVDMMRENGEFATEVLRNILTKMTLNMIESSRKSLYDASDRMLVYLYSYISERKKEKDVYRVVYTKKTLADSIGVSDRTMYRVLNQLKEEGYISTDEGAVTISQKQLKKIETKVSKLNS